MPVARSGGNLGQITPGSTVPEFEAALQKLATGAIASEPVESRFGVHVVRLERRIEGRELPFELVAERIADYLRERVQRTATAQYLQVLAGKADVQGVELTRAAPRSFSSRGAAAMDREMRQFVDGIAKRAEDHAAGRSSGRASRRRSARAPW